MVNIELTNSNNEKDLILQRERFSLKSILGFSVAADDVQNGKTCLMKCPSAPCRSSNHPDQIMELENDNHLSNLVGYTSVKRAP